MPFDRLLAVLVLIKNKAIFVAILLISNNQRSCYAPNFEKVDGAYCFWSVRGWVRACVGAWVTLFVPTVTFKPLKLEF